MTTLRQIHKSCQEKVHDQPQNTLYNLCQHHQLEERRQLEATPLIDIRCLVNIIMYRKEGGRELEATPLIDRTETDGGDQEVSAQIDQKLKQRQRALLKMKNVKNTSFSLITYNKR